METLARLAAIEDIRQVKTRYWRGVDDGDSAMVRAILAPDCVLDYRGCCTDPVTGIDQHAGDEHGPRRTRRMA